MNFWKALDFEKIINDQNKYRSEYNESLENYLDVLNNMN